MKLKTLTTKELRAKKPADISAYLVELELSQVAHNLGLNTNKDKQTHQVEVIKKAIARAKTVQTEANTGKEK